MNWTPEMVRVEMEYRVEQMLGDKRSRQRQALLRRDDAARSADDDAREDHPTWWQRMWAHGNPENGERSAA